MEKPLEYGAMVPRLRAFRNQAYRSKQSEVNAKS